MHLLAPANADPGVPSTDSPKVIVTGCEVNKTKAKWTCPKQYLAITVHLKNTGTQAYLLSGNKATAQYKNSTTTPVRQSSIVYATAPTLNATQAATVAVVAVGSVCLAAPITYDHFKKSKDPTVKYGIDSARRKVELSRLVERVLLPQEQTQGIIYLPAGKGIPRSISIPLYTHPSHENAGIVVIEPNKFTNNQ